MENAKRIGYIWAPAVALGVGLAVANTPAVALAAPGDTGKGSSSGESSQSSDAPSAKSATSATNDAPKPRRHPPKKPDDTAATSTSSAGSADTSPTPKKFDTDVRKRGGTTSRPVVKAAVADPAVSDSSPNLTAATVTPKPADPVSHMVTTLVNAVLSPFAGSAPDRSPVQNPAAFTLLAFTRREFEPTTTVNQPAAPTVTTSVVDPDFISSTHGFFGLFSVTSAADPDDNNYVAFVLRTPFFTNVLTSGTDPEDNLGFGAASIGVAGHTVNTFMSPFLNFSIAIPIEDPFAKLFTALVRAGF